VVLAQGSLLPVRAQSGTVTPEQFGAAGDGVTNDTAAICAAVNTNKNILLTSGKTYLVHAGCLILHPGQNLYADGATIKYAPQVIAHLSSGISGGSTTSFQVDSTAGLTVGTAVSVLDPTSSGIVSVAMISGGTGYTSQPTITAAGGGGSGVGADGSGATFSAWLTSTGTIKAIKVVNPGNGYITETTLSITGGNGSGARAKVILAQNYDQLSQQITNIDGNTVTVRHPFNSSWSPGALVYTTGFGVKAQGSSIVRGLTIDGNKDAISIARWTNSAAVITFGDSNQISGLTLHDIPTEGIIASFNNNTITNCTFNNICGNALHFSGANNTVVDNCTIRNTNLRFSILHSDGAIIWSDYILNTYVSHCYVENTPLAGFGAINQDENRNIYVKDCTVVNAAGWGINAVNAVLNDYPGNLSFTNCRFVSCGPVTFNQKAAGTPQTYEDHITLNQCSFAHTPMFLHQCQYVTLTNNWFTFNGDTASTVLELDACQEVLLQFNKFTGGGIQLLTGSGTSDNVTVDSNRFTGPALEGLLWSGSVGPTGAVVSNNVFYVTQPNAQPMVLNPKSGAVSLQANRVTVRVSGSGQ
jgi:hypothetical protein